MYLTRYLYLQKCTVQSHMSQAGTEKFEPSRFTPARMVQAATYCNHVLQNDAGRAKAKCSGHAEIMPVSCTFYKSDLAQHTQNHCQNWMMWHLPEPSPDPPAFGMDAIPMDLMTACNFAPNMPES